MGIENIRDLNNDYWKRGRRRRVEKKMVFLVVIEMSQPAIVTSMKIQGKFVVTKA